MISLDLLRYLNAGQVTQLREACGQDSGLAAAPPRSRRGRVKAALAARRIRVHLFSGIEFEMTVFVIGPITGFVGGAALAAAALLVIFELRLVRHLWQVTRAVHSLPTAASSMSHSMAAEASLVRRPAGR
ncbi:hypothetical protein [Paractinoplanes toevensis]|uniref:Uncharacterized protein n=1 Tax=Paractinoplanes toevensis TaxID=571911 RepID=A0A919W6X5_9ACTN|nr:hypothetical protein [Actinoplanes toevensis]GIM93783.1 hypothetical protein Ato02nite_055760 [Actinoplanes toevensis]